MADQEAETVTGPVLGHFAGCACCSDPDAQPVHTHFTAGSGSANGALFTQLAPANATVQDVADYLRIDYWSYATDGDWTDGVVWDVSADRTLSYNVNGLSEAAADLARLAFDAWATVVNLEFAETTQDADITFSDAEDGAFSFFDAVRITPDGTPHTIESAFINVSRRWIVDNGSTPDSFSFQTFLHEIGHAIGLGHAGPYNTATNFEANAIFTLDSWQLTVMSYFDQQEAGVGTTSGVRTPMLADMLALQALYGLADNEPGDTVYGFGATASGDAFDASTGSPRATYTVHDTGGTDTLDYSGHANDQRIDLRSTGISDVGGGRGNVIIGPGTVIERVITGAGDDIILATGDTAFINGAGGADIADFSTVSGPLFLDLEAAAGVTLVGIETLIGTSGNDTLLGDAANMIFVGGAGNDVIDGRGSADTVSYADDPSAVVADFANGSATDGFGGQDTISNVRHLVGSGFSDTLAGDSSDNRITGGFGDDILTGGAGNDVLIAYGDGDADSHDDNDVLSGGTGDDVLRVGGGNDLARGGAGNDTLIAEALTPGDRFSLYGGAGNDQIEGSTLDDDLRGGQGNDVILGNKGHDTIFAGGGNDTVMGEQGRDSIFGSGGNDALDGGAGHDVLYGGGGDDTLLGGAGTDQLLSGAGDDTLDGGDGDDELRGASGDDTAFGGAGNDQIIGAVGADILNGDAGDDTLIGGTGNDILRGGADDDSLLGQGGNDVLAGQAGNDLLNGAAGDDQLDGAQGDDTLNGGSGADQLTGGSGDDQLSGQGGIDTFIFDIGDTGTDHVTDFTAGETVRLTGFGYSSPAAAADDFQQVGNDVTFQNSGVEIVFENARLDDVLDGVEVSVAAPTAVSGPPSDASAKFVSLDLHAFWTSTDTHILLLPEDWDSLL
ncbi:MAG: M10 family metallopeptidase [Pseudomonadota bacterium]